MSNRPSSPHAELEAAVEAAWEERESLSPATGGPAREAVEATLDALDAGRLRVAEPPEEPGGDWRVNQWAKKAVLLSFRLNDMRMQKGGPQGGGWWDKVDSKFAGWDEARWREAGFRAVPSCVVRRSAYVAPGAVLMPCFVNLGAHVGEGSMVDTWATVGSCAQIGRGVHLSGGVASAACSSPSRPARPSSRTAASSARARRWSRASWCARGRSSAWACSSASPRRSWTGRAGR